MVFHMKSFVTITIIFSVFSFSTYAMDVRHAEMNVVAAEAGVHVASDNRYESHNQNHTMQTDRDAMNAAGAALAQAHSDLNVAHEEEDNAAAAKHAEQVSNYGTKGNPNLVSQINPSTNATTPVYNGVSQRPATVTQPTTPPGYVVTAHPPFAGEAWGNHTNQGRRSENHGGRGNGGNNAANSNSAHGLGGGDHIGGGRSGGGYHY